MSKAVEYVPHYERVLNPMMTSHGHLWGSPELLKYFQGRTGIQYFPVVDEVETARAKIDAIVQGRKFEFNHETHVLPAAICWTENPSQDLEWLILLHKFYYAVGLGLVFDETKDSRYLQVWQELTQSWIDTVSLEFLPSDVTGRRIQNWIFAHYYFVTKNSQAVISLEFYQSFLHSLQQQVSYLCEHLTIARNHRTLELCAIFLAAVVFPEFDLAADWLEFSKVELVKNIQTDLQQDGVHCEQSTDYHHLVLKNYLWVRRLALINKIYLPAVMDDQIQKALNFALYVHKPDGFIPSISDGDSRCFYDLLEQGYAIYGKEEFRYVYTKGQRGTAPAERSVGFVDSGYYILRSGWGNTKEAYEDERYLFFDCGSLGVGNHGHFDLLNIEMAAYGRSLIVDPGRYTYDETGKINWRVRFRGTAYHNTVLVDGLNQTRYLPGKNKYKIKGPEPDRELKAFVSQPGFEYLHGIARSHEYPVTHERKIALVAGQYWIVADLLIANEPHSYELLFHLSNEAFGRTALTEDEYSFYIDAPHLVLAQPRSPEIQVRLQDGWMSRIYGEKYPAPIVKYLAEAASHCYYTVLLPYKEERPELSIHMQSVKRGTTSCLPTQALALKISMKTGSEQIQDTIVFNHDPDAGSITLGRLECSGSVLCVRQDENETEKFRFAILHGRQNA